MQSIEQLLEDKGRLAQISDELIKLAEPLAEKEAREEVAKIVIEMLRWASAAIAIQIGKNLRKLTQAKTANIRI